MAQTRTLIVSFKESPFSPWGAACLQTRTPGGVSHALTDGHGSLRFQTIGSISAVNAQVGEFGLRKRSFLPPLVAEEAVVEPERMEDQGQSKKTESDDAKESSDAKLIELANFPGFSPEHPTPLPHGLDTLEHLKLVTRAQPRLALKREGFRECWKKLFYSPHSQAIFLDTFWWFFLHKYQPNAEIQDKLFSRVSMNYVQLLCEDCEFRWRDIFFKVYPSVLAQGVYSAFMHAFPTSWSSFDDDFKTELCKIVFLWQVGTKPIPNLWQRWDLGALEPPNLLRHMGKEDQSPTSPTKGFHLDALVKDTRRKDGTAMDASEVSIVGLTPPTGIALSGARRGTTASGLHESISSTDSSADGEAAKYTSRPVSFAELERALSSHSRLLQQPEHVTNARTHGEVTPTQQSTGAQRKKIEVARQQLAKLKMQKVMEAKAKAARKGSRADRTPVKHSTTSAGTQSRPSQYQLQAPTTSQAKPPPPRTQKQLQSPAKAAVPASKLPDNKSSATLSGAVGKTARSNPTVHLSQADSIPSALSSSQQKPSGGSVPTKTTESRVGSSLVAGEKQSQSAKVDKQQGTAVERRDAEEKTRDHQGGTWKEKALTMKKKEPSMPIAGPEFERVVFDAHGQSPLVKHYLQRRNLSYDSGYSLLLQRTEVNKLPPTNTLTYEDIIRDSSVEDKKNHAQFRSHYAHQKQSMAHNHQQRKRAAAKHSQDTKKVLADKKEVQQLASQLAVYRNQKGEKVGDRQAASKAVAESLRRVS